jgi:hypothetical protein
MRPETVEAVRGDCDAGRTLKALPAAAPFCILHFKLSRPENDVA